jgi:DNA-binding NarL/FixJ family response regulator
LPPPKQGNVTTPQGKTSLCILIVEDNPTDRQLIRYLLEPRLPDVGFHEAPDLQTACHFLEQGGVNLVILDLGLPDSVGGETFTKLSGLFPNVPFIVLTNTRDRELAMDMVRAGAADYLLKDYTDEDEIFQRIMLALTKYHRHIRVPPENAEVFHRLDKAKAGLQKSRRERRNTDMQLHMSDTTHAMADVSQMTFATVQKLAAQQEHMAATITVLDKELLRGHSGFPPMKTQIEVLNHRLTATEEQLKGLSNAGTYLAAVYKPPEAPHVQP